MKSRICVTLILLAGLLCGSSAVLAHRVGPTAGATQLPRTGQTTSYAAGDDGDMQAGAAWPSPRFTDHGDGTVSDRLTGLMWTQDPQQSGATMDWQAGLDYVAGMNAGTNPNYGYGGWRLPNRFEVQSMLDYGHYFPALPPGHPFAYVYPAWFSIATSTTSAAENVDAWGLGMQDGGMGTGYKGHAAAIWPVRDDTAPLTGHAIDGRVTWNGVGLGGVEITLSGPQGSGAAYTNADGDFALTYLPDGNYTLRAAREYYGFSPALLNVTLVGADVGGQDFTAHLTASHGWVDLSTNLPREAQENNLHDAFFIGDEGWLSGGWVAGIYHTTDGGQTWEVQTDNLFTPIHAIAMRTTTEGYAVGESGFVYRTTDGGDHWTYIGTIGAKHALDVTCPPTGDICYACGWDGAVNPITGDTVGPHMPALTTCDLHSISFPVDSSEGWVCGQDGSLRHYSDGEWKADQSSMPITTLTGIHFLDNDNGWIVAASLIRHTANGKNWFEQTFPPEAFPAAVYFVDLDEGFVVGQGGTILHTSDGGQHWGRQAEGLTHETLTSVFMVDHDTGYAVGTSGAFLKYIYLGEPVASPYQVYLPLVCR